MVLLGWIDLALVFLGEVLTVGAFADWGTHQGGWPLAVAISVVMILGWMVFASPKSILPAPIRETARVAIFLLAAAALWHSGHPTLAVIYLLYNAVVNAIAQLPSIKVLAQP